jgi:D-tyrosyl-tRNA(Tyr) deacylase
MRVVIQRVSRASVTIAGNQRSAIGPGLLVWVGVEESDGPGDVEWLSEKILKLRVFADEAGRMNRSVLEIAGEVMVVSQFTLHASTRKGSRPSFLRAATPETARPLCEAFADRLGASLPNPVATGEFGASMQVALVNDGPVTFVMDSKARE